MPTENNVAAQAGDFDPAPKYEYSSDGKTVTWTNRDRMPKVAAQAGDEPMPCTCPSGDGSLRWPCPQHPPELDVVVEANRALLHARSQLGIKKYGGTLGTMRHSRRALLQHALEEALDLANYLQADIQAIDREAAQVSPRATADVERDAARYRWLLRNSVDESTLLPWPIVDWMRGWPIGKPELDEAIDAAIATTKPGA